MSIDTISFSVLIICIIISVISCLVYHSLILTVNLSGSLRNKRNLAI